MEKMIDNARIDIISMGCSKNLIDSEKLMHRLYAKGYDVVHDSPDPCGAIVIVNTCGFIADAKEESINLLLGLAEKKEHGEIGKIFAMGCLSERYLETLKVEMPEVDRWYGKFNWNEIVDSLPDRSLHEHNDNHKDIVNSCSKDWERILTTPPWSAFLKISEGCDRFCAFCAIPFITGRHKSRPIEEIEEEVKDLVSKGVTEFNIIAQDLSSYGKDIYGRKELAELIRRISDINGVKWIRLHYAYPADFPEDILPVIRERENVCAYLDIALQHIAEPVLKNMHRNITKQETIELLEKIRHEVPDISIRTTLMVGFPGEDDDAYSQLLEFVKAQKFNRLGAFAYSEENDTWAANMLDDNIPPEIKQARLDKLLSIQEEIALENNRKLIGHQVEVLIERIEDGNSVGRTQWDSPDVDNEIIVKGFEGVPGTFIKAKITDAMPYDLFAEKI